MRIRPFSQDDFESVQAIYQQGIDTLDATFQTEQKTWKQWQEAMIDGSTLVMLDDGQQVIGWAGLSAISSRPVYRGVAEVSIYMAQQVAGQGFGSQLFQQMIEHSEKLGFWTLQSAIFPENKGSVRLHQKQGFRLIGERKGLGKMNGVWRDVLLFERRSDIVGID